MWPYTSGEGAAVSSHTTRFACACFLFVRPARLRVWLVPFCVAIHERESGGLYLYRALQEATTFIDVMSVAILDSRGTSPDSSICIIIQQVGGGWRGGFQYAQQHLFGNKKAKEHTASWLQYFRKKKIAVSSLPL